MSGLARTAVGPLRSVSRSSVASGSRNTIRQATTTSKKPDKDAKIPDLVYESEKKNEEKTYIKKMRGPGIPMLNSLKHVVRVIHPHLWKGDPIRDLTTVKHKTGGRNNTGQITMRHIGGGHKRRLRNVDFYRFDPGEHDVVRIEYDPGRSAHIALIRRRSPQTALVTAEEGSRLAEAEAEIDAALANMPGRGGTLARDIRDKHRGGWSYILAPDGLRAGHVVVSYRSGIPKGLVEGWEDVLRLATSPTPELDAEASGTSAARTLGLLRTVTLRPGNVLPLYLIPTGTEVHNISLSATNKMSLCRSAGASGTVVAHFDAGGQALTGTDILTMGGAIEPDVDVAEDAKKGAVVIRMPDDSVKHFHATPTNGVVHVRLQSGEIRKVQPGAVATIGAVSNREHQQRVLGKAGRARWLGRRPSVRGVAMNATDHPHGGGRGKSKGNKAPRTKWGLLTSKRTRRPRDKNGNKMVVTQRPRGVEKRTR